MQDLDFLKLQDQMQDAADSSPVLQQAAAMDSAAPSRFHIFLYCCSNRKIALFALVVLLRINDVWVTSLRPFHFKEVAAEISAKDPLQPTHQENIVSIRRHSDGNIRFMKQTQESQSNQP